MVGKFAMVEKVQIEKVNDKTVTFATRSGSKSGDPDECLRRSFTCPVSEIWTTPIDGAPPPVAMKPGAVGNLFLSGTALDTTTSDGFPIYGAGTPLLRVKWPDNAAGAQMLGELSVIPSSIVVRGTLQGTAFFELELLGPDAADAQHIAWNGAHGIALQLTARGAKRLHLGDHAMSVEVWPTRITITGAPVIDPSVTGSVDILDSERAGLAQDFKFARHRAAIRLELTPDGFSAFHAVPGAAAASQRHHASRRG
jgi:hypothetical protein